MLCQLSYIATHWERGQFIEFVSPVRSETKSLKKRLQASSFQLLKLEKLNCNVHSSPSSTTAVRIELFHISFTSKCKLVIYQLWYYYFGCEITSTLRKCLRALLPEIIICFEKGHLRLSFEIFNLVKDPFYSLGGQRFRASSFYQCGASTFFTL